ncbi:hypothetical protein MOMA_06971 [Moraxella macacae 0408225]|uniref:Uncharacterized protein n=1 Tax=Moraxella macacae 0408225 TaxID=1230338 RepID=L2F5F2_9GAMM|nr:hypothetical protein [Moraxella macacae]ELA08284.1 hypothetical protein MOMA_06971 [Moraxella macacae 0408225]
MSELEIIGQLYLDWLQAHLDEYGYHKAFMQALDDKLKSEQPPNYDTWHEYSETYFKKLDKSQELHKQLTDKANEYLNKRNKTTWN